MSVTSVFSAASLLSLVFFATTVSADDVAKAGQSPGNSKVRIVRLSEVRGDVQLDRAAGDGSDAAITNLPIVENNQLRTGAGIAEVEFEDNSTLRLAPYTRVQFAKLQRLPDGGTLSEVRLLQGTAYVSLLKTQGNQFTLDFGSHALNLQPASHVRLEMTAANAKLAVLGGSVQVDEAGGPVEVPKKRTVTFALQDANEPEIAKKVEQGNFDSWDKQSVDYHARAASFGPGGNAPYAYGVSDMMYYGSFADMGGCGMMWRPYFASAAWSPYANGTWAWYQGAGYSWVSPYPWGWTPYHYGAWSFCPGAGWGWMPGGAWNGLTNNVPAVAGGATGPVIEPMPHPPVHAPRLGSPGLIPINLKPLVQSNLGADNSFVFRRDSAGLGVPRVGMGNLNSFSRNAVRTGAVHTPVYMTAGGASASAGRTPPGGNLAPIMVHRGFAGGAEGPVLMGAGNSGRSPGGPGAGAVNGPGATGARAPMPPGGGSAPRAVGGGGFGGGGHMSGAGGMGGGGARPAPSGGGARGK